jgi:cation transport ATPase
MNTFPWAQIAAIALTGFAGLSLYQLIASHAEFEAKALRFKELALENESASLMPVRVMAYGVVPLAFLGLLYFAGLPLIALAAGGLKIALSGTLSIWMENRLLLGEGYSPVRHRLARLDSLINVGVAAALIYALLYMRRW